MRRSFALVLPLAAVFPLLAQPSPSFTFTGEFQADRIDLAPDGKFDTLRVHLGVVTPGGQCSWSGRLFDQAGVEIDLENGEQGAILPVGKTALALYFHRRSDRSP